MNDGLVRTSRDLVETRRKAPAPASAEQTHGQKSQIDERVFVRVTDPTDTEGLRRMFSRVSSETTYQRFHISYLDVPERMLELMVSQDRHEAECLVAVAKGEIVGHAMYVKLGDSNEAEMAIIVEDALQSRGVGKALLRNLVERARSRGVETFVGTVLLENRRMLGLIGTVFAEAKREIVDGVYHFRAPLRTQEAPGPARILRRAA